MFLCPTCIFTPLRVIVTVTAAKIVMEMKHGSVHLATFSIISAQNALEAALFFCRVFCEHAPVYPLQVSVTKTGHCGVCCGDNMIWFTPASLTPSYLILAGAPRRVHGTLLCISCKASCLLHDGGWMMLGAGEAHSFPGEVSE